LHQTIRKTHAKVVEIQPVLKSEAEEFKWYSLKSIVSIVNVELSVRHMKVSTEEDLVQKATDILTHVSSFLYFDKKLTLLRDWKDFQSQHTFIWSMRTTALDS
jgi:predicted site-specific integrase-resolvase